MSPQTAPLASTWVAHRVLIHHLNFQGIAYWSPTISHWPLATPSVHKVFMLMNPLLISYLFHDITYHLDPVLSASQPHESGTPCLSTFVKPSHFLLLNAILRLTFSSQLTPPPSDPPSNVPWFFNRLWRYISFVLTYLLTFSIICSHFPVS